MSNKRRFLRILILVALFTSVSFNQELGKWRTTNNFTMKEGDVYLLDAIVMHILANYYLSKKFDDFGMKWWKSDLSTLALGVLWEIKDGLVPVEKVAVIGGDGFSTSDLAANASIIFINRIIKISLSKIKMWIRKKPKNHLVKK